MAARNDDQEISQSRLPPASKEAEDGVLGALLIDNNVYDMLAGKITSDDFYHYENRLIFEAISKLIDENRPADTLTVFDRLRETGKELETGGLEYLTRLSDFIPGAANVLRYAEIIRERSIRRRLIQVGGEIASDAWNPEGREAKDLLDEAQAKVLGVSEELNRSTGGFQKIDRVLASYTEQLQELYELDSSSNVTGVATGFPQLDNLTSGLHDGELIIVAARPAMGKTSFALNVASYVATADKLPVAIFSLEMPAEQLAARLVSAQGKVKQEVLKTGKLSPGEWENFYDATAVLGNSQIFIDDTSPMSILSLRSRARQLKSRMGQLGLIVIDYLQLMDGESRRNAAENRATELSEISRGLKSLAKELKCPVIALSQLNRAVETRPDKRPMMSDLRESGAIEQDADLILFLHRPAAYPGFLKPDGTPWEPNYAQLIIGKHRNGPTGEISMVFMGEYTLYGEQANPDQDTPEYVEGVPQ